MLPKLVGSNVATAVQAATTGLVDLAPFLDSGTNNDGGAVGFTVISRHSM